MELVFSVRLELLRIKVTDRQILYTCVYTYKCTLLQIALNSLCQLTRYYYFCSFVSTIVSLGYITERYVWDRITVLCSAGKRYSLFWSPEAMIKCRSVQPIQSWWLWGLHYWLVVRQNANPPPVSNRASIVSQSESDALKDEIELTGAQD